uniref:BTB domain-containing protein n=1 Tax=Panagrolaimus sp. PS1159 TaxID=55785 RepID=A0AC35FCH9_9BILA
MANLKRKFAKDQVYPFSFEWIIKEETLREDKFSLETPEFDIPNFSDVKYYVTLIPTDNFTLIYLNLTPNNMKITAKCNVLCKSADISITLSPSTASQTWCNDLLDTSKNFIVDKKLVLFITGSFTIENVDEVEAKMAKVDKNLGLMLWESEADKNVSIVIDGENKLKAHECVLKRRSPKFAKLLNVKPEPGTPSVEAKIVIENKPFDTVKEAIMYCYDIQNSDALTSENAANILVFAEEYEIHDLKKNMEEFCIENLSVSNACLFANSSITAKSEKLKRECLKFLSNCMKTATAVKDISELNQELKEILFLQSFVTTFVIYLCFTGSFLGENCPVEAPLKN